MRYQIEYWEGPAGFETRDESKVYLVDADTSWAALNAVVPEEYQVHPWGEHSAASGPRDSRNYTDSYFVEELLPEAYQDFRGMKVIRA
jgi:hypothetical protein